MNEIYILVKVSYQHELRLQRNLYVGTKKECMDYLNTLFTNYPVYTYEKLDSDLAKELLMKETTHYWLEKFEIK